MQEPPIYISYRRDDTGFIAHRLADDLSREFGVSVFLDVKRIESAEIFPQVIANAVENARVVLVLIGPRWLTAHDEYGRRRLDNTDDWVSREIELALTGKVPVIPVLVEGARLPPIEALPKHIVPLAEIQAVILRTQDWHNDFKVLANALSRFGIHKAPDSLQTPGAEKPRVFVTYSRRDEELFQEFRVHIAHWEEEGALRIWRDQDIEPGEEWHERIQKELSECTLALLLISAYSLASSYVRRHELPHILSRHERGDIQLACLYLRPTTKSSRRVKVPFPKGSTKAIAIDRYQGLNQPDSPINLFDGASREQELVRAAEKLEHLAGLYPEQEE